MECAGGGGTSVGKFSHVIVDLKVMGLPRRMLVEFGSADWRRVQWFALAPLVRESVRTANSYFSSIILRFCNNTEKDWVSLS